MVNSLPSPLRQHLPQALAAFLAILAIAGLIAGASGCSGSSRPAAANDAAPTSATPVATDRAALDTLPIKGRAPKTGYSRDEFGVRWSDDVDVEFGHNGCDTRNDILARDLVGETFKARTHDCVVLTGLLHDPYTGTDINFQRGQSTSSAVQIDHVVPLSDAWQKGAQQWDAAKRQNFANDPRNLLAVDGPLNQQKSAGDAATWLPPNTAFHCEYAQKIVEVKVAYGLWVTEAEKATLETLLAEC